MNLFEIVCVFFCSQFLCSFFHQAKEGKRRQKKVYDTNADDADNDDLHIKMDGLKKNVYRTKQ